MAQEIIEDSDDAEWLRDERAKCIRAMTDKRVINAGEHPAWKLRLGRIENRLAVLKGRSK
jgi:hypothetical protein